MDAMTQNGSGSTVESQEDDDEGRIKSLSELRSLWEGMASKNDRTLKSGAQRKPQLVRGDKSSRQMEETAGLLTTSPLATVPGTMTTPTSSVAMVTIALVAPSSSSTTKVKCSVTTPASDMEHTPRFNATVPGSTAMSAAIPMATHQTIPMATHQTISMATHQTSNSLAKYAISTTTTPVTNSMTRPSSLYTAAISNSMPTTTNHVAAITTSTSTSGGILRNDVTSSSTDNGSSRPSSLPFSADRCVKVDGPNRSQILRLVDDGSDGARQTVTVERTEEELTEEMMEALQVSGDPSKGVTNVEVVEERLDVELSNGLAHVKVTVYCERIVPNRMTGQSYRKSSVTVTRMTEVDMLATPERRRIYERVVDRYGGTPEEDVSYRNALVPRNKLSTDDVYALYRVFVEVTGQSRSSPLGDPGNQLMVGNLSKTEVAGLELLNGQSLPLSLLRLGPLISPVSLTQ